MPRFAKTEVAVELVGYSKVTANPTVLIKDGAGTIHTLSIKGVRFDLDGRIIGKVKGYSKNKRYIVNFGGAFDYYIKVRDCHTPNLNTSSAKETKASVAYDMWVSGRLMRGWIFPKKNRTIGSTEYTARIDIEGKSVAGKARQDSEGKLYFVPNNDSKNSNLL